ncbi:MAG: dipeptidase [Clostridiales bacterium]|nr:dipeptidase [Clostridiales bacterium]
MKVVDMHCDTVLELFEEKKEQKSGSLLSNQFHIDLEKMIKGDYLLQNFALFINLNKTNNPYLHCLELLDTICCEVQKNNDKIRLVKNYADIKKNQEDGVMSAMLTVEEGGAIQGSLVNLRNLYRLGVRMMTLTWNYKNEIGYPNCLTPEGVKVTYGQSNTTNGLTEFGLELVEEMNRIGMIIDVSHMSDAGFYDVVKYSKQPFVASHSNARSICPHVRNMTDDMIRTLSEHGGVMGLNYEGEFLREVTKGQPLYSKLDIMVAHVKHIINVGGYESLGLGSDFDGINTPQDLKDASCLPMLAQALEDAGLKNQEIEAIFHKNVLRVYRDVLK